MIALIVKIIYTAIMYSVPVLLTCAYTLGWALWLKIILTVLGIAQFAYICGSLTTKDDQITIVWRL